MDSLDLSKTVSENLDYLVNGSIGSAALWFVWRTRGRNMLKRADTESAVEEAHKYNVDALQKGMTDRDDVINELRAENERYRQEQRERVESENASLRTENEALRMELGITKDRCKQLHSQLIALGEEPNENKRLTDGT